MTDDKIIDLSAPYGRKLDGTPRKPRGFQRGGSEYRPSSGTPAGGFIASPARGDAAIKGAGALIPGQPPEKRALTEKNQLNREVAAEEAMQMMYSIMHDTEAGHATQLQASEKLLNRIEGAPVQRILGGTVKTVEEIRTTDPIEASKEYRRIIGGQ